MFPNTTTKYRIYACDTDSTDVELNKHGNIVIKGGLRNKLDMGVEYTAHVEKAQTHPIHGPSYIVHDAYQDIPESEEDQKQFLKAMLTKNQVDEVYKVYPDSDIINLIVENKLDYSKIKGIGLATYEKIREKIMSNIEHKKLFSKLGKYGITHSMIIKLSEEFGSNEATVQRIEMNPYELTRLPGISFIKADIIAKNMGIEPEAPFRIESGVRHILSENQKNGNTYMLETELIEESRLLLDVDYSFLYKTLEQSEMYYIKGNKVSIKYTYETEEYISNRLKEILSNKKEMNFNPESFIAKMETKYKDILPNGLSEQQKKFFHNFKKYSVNLLIGYAGTGKSQMQRLLIDLLEELNVTYILTAPTGKAAKVLSKYTGKKAITIHRATGYGKPKKMQDEITIPHEVIVIDESSMPDIFIIQSLLKKAKNPNVRIVFSGDAFQIPSVGAGCILHDMIESKVIPSTMLDVVFRQSDGGILDIATKIRKNEKFIEDGFRGMVKYGENLIIHSVEQDEMERGYKHYYNMFLKNYSPEDIMILTPTKKANLGTFEINRNAQEIVNPPNNQPEFPYGKTTIYRVGDYVINTKNTYSISNSLGEIIDIVNGDMGSIINIITEYIPNELDKDEDNRGVVIDFDGNIVKVDFNDLIQIQHGWSLTKHKSQGSSTIAAIIISDKSHKFQSSANLLYTAITRISGYGVILCQAENINFAMRKVENLRRNTHLCDMLKS